MFSLVGNVIDVPGHGLDLLPRSALGRLVHRLQNHILQVTIHTILVHFHHLADKQKKLLGL